MAPRPEFFPGDGTPNTSALTAAQSWTASCIFRNHGKAPCKSHVAPRQAPDLPRGPQGRCLPLGRSLLPQSVFKHVVNAVNLGSNLRESHSAVLRGLLIGKHLPTSLAPTVSSWSENDTRRLCFSVRTPHTRAHTCTHSRALGRLSSIHLG